ncbi:MAG: Serine/threonine-protein kinase PknD [Phycisphaerae bacterium]|nr:Serine/threonine-protein kinase PknD [Phycisphaerae bacterium]
MPSSRFQQLEALYQQILNCPPEQRAARLKELCNSTRLLTEVQALLDHSTDQDILPAPAILQPISQTLQQMTQHWPTGYQLGAYTIDELIGSGGMGLVYRAHRTDGSYQAQVAIKVVRQAHIDRDLRDRFYRERQTLANLQHPNIARLLDGGTAPDGSPYLVMDYIIGESITTYCRRTALPLTQRLQLFIAVCHTVQYAHQNLVIHRDLKPGNILITAEGTPRLLDFGLAKLLDQDAAPLDTDNPQDRLKFMTPEYASPEQVRGESVSTATDLYSLGVILYELLTGVRPYDWPTRSLLDMERIICEQIPPTPSTQLRRQHHPRGRLAENPPVEAWPIPRLHHDLDLIVMKALRKEPNERYGSALQLAGDLQRYLTGYPILAEPSHRLYRLQKFCRRNRTIVLAITLLFFALLGGLITVSYQSRQIRLESQKATQLNQALRNILLAWDPLGEPLTDQLISDSFTTGQPQILSILQQFVRSVEQADITFPEVEAELRFLIGRIYLNHQYLDPADEQLVQALALQEKIYGREHPVTALTLAKLALLQNLRGHYDRAEQLARESLTIRRRTLPANHLHVAAGLSNLASILSNSNRHAEALPLLEEALAIRRKLYGAEDVEVAKARQNLATINFRLGDYATAEQQLTAAIDIYHRSRAIQHYNWLGLCRMRLAHVYLLTWKPAAAQEQLQQAHDIFNRYLEPDHPFIAEAQLLQAQLELQWHRYPQALLEAAHGCYSFQQRYSAAHPKTIQALHLISLAQQSLIRPGPYPIVGGLTKP